MKSFCLFLIIFTSATFANSQKYEIKMDWTINHKFIGSSTKPGVENEITSFIYPHDDIVEFFEVTPKELKKIDGREGIFLETTLGKKNKNNQKTIIHKGTLVQTINPDVQIMLNSNSKTEHVFINMKVIRLNP